MDENGYLGVGVLIHRLLGNTDPDGVCIASMGKVIAALALRENALRFEFADGSKMRLFDNGQSCCEKRYMVTDDALGDFVGATFAGAETRRRRRGGTRTGRLRRTRGRIPAGAYQPGHVHGVESQRAQRLLWRLCAGSEGRRMTTITTKGPSPWGRHGIDWPVIRRLVRRLRRAARQRGGWHTRVRVEQRGTARAPDYAITVTAPKRPADFRQRDAHGKLPKYRRGPGKGRT